MRKIACLFSFQKSSWVSCQKIVFNLHKAYQEIPEAVLLNFNYSETQKPNELEQLAQDIISADPDTIVVMDHRPHPYNLMRQLLPFYKNKKRLRIIIHIFGDFTLFYDEWMATSNYLNGFSVDFVVASERQKILIDKFLIAPQASLVCPFPVNPEEFSFAPQLRDWQRREWNLKEDEIAFVFTGRLTRQKRTSTLLKLFKEVAQDSRYGKIHLFLYGNSDSIGDPFMGKRETEGEYFRKIFRYYESLPPGIKERVHLMGAVPNAKLKPVYQGADVLINLSVHNDEDYGMSVAEALCSGLPCILTDWGGLASFTFSDCPEATQFIPVTIDKKGKTIAKDQATQALIKIAEGESLHLSRANISRMAFDKFGIEQASSILIKLLNASTSKFSKFSPTFENICTHRKLYPTPYLDPKKGGPSKLYRELYSSYVRNT